ncbi:protein KRTCAP2 [Sesamum angolense]|uniref:Protein KRTCAP2 n=1 Tax=Sesamum angolense TaxID=2727404 RepID=A0AAE1WCZ7_9LAMI|nr:protein KRTCAP2 [Sesamum angolense]
MDHVNLDYFYSSMSKVQGSAGLSCISSDLAKILSGTESGYVLVRLAAAFLDNFEFLLFVAKGSIVQKFTALTQTQTRHKGISGSSNMAGAGSSMLYSFLLFVVTLSLQEMYRAKLASSELFTILGGFTSSLIFLLLLTFIGNYQETCGIRTGWGTVIFAEAVALIAASTVHRVCITTWDDAVQK